MTAPGASDPKIPVDVPSSGDAVESTGPRSLRVPPRVDVPPAAQDERPAPQSARVPSPADFGPPTPRSTLPDLDVEFSTSNRSQSHGPPRSASDGTDPDTLISAPRPAPREALDPDERIRLLEDRVDELEARLRLLEKPRTESSEVRSQPWWIWLVFLLGLAVTWRLLQALH